MLLVLDRIRFSLKDGLNPMQNFKEMLILKFTVTPLVRLDWNLSLEDVWRLIVVVWNGEGQIVPTGVLLNGKKKNPKMFRRSTI